jgi:hypothetical protein
VPIGGGPRLIAECPRSWPRHFWMSLAACRGPQRAGTSEVAVGHVAGHLHASDGFLDEHWHINAAVPEFLARAIDRGPANQGNPEQWQTLQLTVPKCAPEAPTPRNKHGLPDHQWVPNQSGSGSGACPSNSVQHAKGGAGSACAPAGYSFVWGCAGNARGRPTHAA